MAQQCFGLVTRYVVRRGNKDRVFCIPRSFFFKHQSLSYSTGRRLIFVCYDIPRFLIHEPNKRTTHVIDSLLLLHISITHWVTRSHLLKKPRHPS